MSSFYSLDSVYNQVKTTEMFLQVLISILNFLILLLVIKHFVPLGYLVYAFNYSSISGGNISSWKELRQDIHKFLKFVISPRSYVFIYCRSAGCLVILDYLLHQPGIQDIIKGNNFLTI